MDPLTVPVSLWSFVDELGAGVAILILLAFLVMRTWRDDSMSTRTMQRMEDHIMRLDDALSIAREHNRSLTAEMAEAAEVRRQLIADLADSARDRAAMGERIANMAAEIRQLRSENKALREQVARLTSVMERRQPGSHGRPPGGVERRAAR